MHNAMRETPVSDFKLKTSEVLDQLNVQREPMRLTEGGETRAVLVDPASFNETQETMALLRMLALGHQDVKEGQVVAFEDLVAELKAQTDLI